ncbi:hypothetical protein C0099_08080 [Pseudazoarcus pumilus]|uniref:DUF2459 domain-containing protein n=1 Tax=Pseudazoarcus pumilus TaxID=2067960 RepID=A0A2I6S6N2_9RHOO|nr:hypothetical protein C0099_08080 [Pseudazoarcus pumilus]
MRIRAPSLEWRLTRSRALVTLGCLFVLFTVFALAGCSARIVPPAEPLDPVSVWVLDHGRHSSLLLPAEDGINRYSWGDWQWYAEGVTGITSGLKALFVPSPSALGRQHLPEATDLKTALSRMSVGVAASTELRVEAEAARRLRTSLDARFDDATQRRYNPDYDLLFIADPRPYSLGDNSNRRVGEWLTELGCEIRGNPLLSGWRLADPR